MPSSAQNEYIRVYAKEGRSFENDCNVLATLARGIENGTLFDIIFGDMADGKPDYEMSQSHISEVRTWYSLSQTLLIV